MTDSTKGLLSLAQLKQLAKEGEIDTVLTVFTGMHGFFLGKRLDSDFFLENFENGIGACNYLLTIDMEMTPLDGFHSSSWDSGYGDFLLQPDLNTLRYASWLERTAIVLCDVLDEKSKQLVETAPRSMLRKQVQRLSKLGLTVKAASELEYYIFENNYQEAHEQRYQDLQSISWYGEDYHILQGTREEPLNGAVRQHLKASAIPVENSKGETGKGQHELNICYAEALEMADRHCLLKQCMKEIADQLGISVTFMAKPDAEQAGSSCHIHLSLWQQDKNAFAGDENLNEVHCSAIFKHFLAGWIKYTPELMPLLAPTINAYKRYQKGSWAPTNVAWSPDNRTAGFRIVGHGDSLRIECRIAGSDVNPYLAFTAALIAGVAGIEEKLEPPPCLQGNAYQMEDIVTVPETLTEAVDLFSKSTLAKNALGETVVDDYVKFYQYEIAAFNQAVTDWEMQRYFERI